MSEEITGPYKVREGSGDRARVVKVGPRGGLYHIAWYEHRQAAMAVANTLNLFHGAEIGT